MKKGKHKTRKFPSSKYFFLIVLAFIVLGVAAGYGIYLLLQPFADPAKPSESLYDLVRTTATILGVITVGGAAAIQYRKQRFAEASAELEWDMKYASLLTTAIEHLGHESAAVRKGALYELRRLAVDSEKDRKSVLKIISHFIIEKRVMKWATSWLDCADIQAEIDISIEILCSLIKPKKNDTDIIDLTGIDLSGGNLSGADLSLADLSEADFFGTDLSEANLSDVNLSGANLSEANLSKANLSEAKLSGAKLSKAKLSGADLTDAKLSGADLSEADLSGAELSGAKLSGADLSGADLLEAHFFGTDLSRADLRHARNLTAKQLENADTDETTFLDENIRAELAALKQKTPTAKQ